MQLTQYSLNKLSSEELWNLTGGRHSIVEGASELVASAGKIMDDVVLNGIEALLRYTLELDGVKLDQLYLDKEEIEAIAATIEPAAAAAIDMAYSTIYAYHKAQLQQVKTVETAPGIRCWRESRPVDCAGLYVPGGSAVLPSTFLMLGIPARLAGVPEIVVCSPPQKNGSRINCYIAYVATLLKINRIYTIGGAQAITAMGYGIAGIPKADKIYGPGNSWVTAAKQLIQQRAMVAIDMPAGPSEVMVVGDLHSDPEFAASDLLAQAEHGPTSQVVLVSTSADFIEQVNLELAKQLPLLPRAAIAEKALANSYAMLAETMEEAIGFSNAYAPEHLILLMDDAEKCIPSITSAGSVFLGAWSPESVGDYASGTNHTLPTSGYARMYSGLSVGSFQKQISFQKLTAQGLQFIGPTVETLAGIEGLHAHGRAVTLRLEKLKNT